MSIEHTAMNKRAVEAGLWLAATAGIGGLVFIDGEVPSTFTALFFLPICFAAYRYPLAFSVLLRVHQRNSLDRLCVLTFGFPQLSSVVGPMASGWS